MSSIIFKDSTKVEYTFSIEGKCPYIELCCQDILLSLSKISDYCSFSELSSFSSTSLMIWLNSSVDNDDDNGVLNFVKNSLLKNKDIFFNSTKYFVGYNMYI